MNKQIKIILLGLAIWFSFWALYFVYNYLSGETKYRKNIQNSVNVITPTEIADPYNKFEKESAQTKIKSENNLDYRTFAISHLSNFKINGEYIYDGNVKNPDFLFFHDIDLLTEILRGNAKLDRPIEGVINKEKFFAVYSKAKANKTTVKYYFPNMAGVGYLFVCEYIDTYSSGEQICNFMLRSVIPITKSLDRYNKEMQTIQEMFTK